MESRSSTAAVGSCQIERNKDAIKFGGKLRESIPDYATRIKRNKKKEIKSEVPQLVELQQYPGFSDKNSTPLPHSVLPSLINKTVVNAQYHLDTKKAYKTLFERTLATQQHQSLLMDFFWWFFLQKYSPNVEVQAKLFRRIADNYGQLFMTAGTQRYRDVFLMTYPDVLAQSLYSSFCHAFPQSWKQFDDDDFKNMLSRVTAMWISGVRPFPRAYLKWNQEDLEPNKMREGQAFKTKGNKRKDTDPRTSKIIKTVVDFGSSKTSSGVYPRSMSSNSKVDSSSTFRKKISRSTYKRMNSVSSRRNGVSIKEISEMFQYTSSHVHSRDLCFEHSKFNLNGQSPLLSEYFHQRGISRPSRADFLVPRTQIMSLPKFDCLTLTKVIEDSKKLTTGTRQRFEGIQNNGKAAFMDFRAKLKEDNKIFGAKTKRILEDQEQVSFLSNLVMTEIKHDPNVPPTEAQRTIWQVLQSTTTT